LYPKAKASDGDWAGGSIGSEAYAAQIGAVESKTLVLFEHSEFAL